MLQNDVKDRFGMLVNKIMFLVLVAAMVGVCTSCTHRITITSPAQLTSLPPSAGFNGGSFVALTAWEYRGSDQNAHWFRYYYNKGNALRHRTVLISRDIAVLHFPESVRDKASPRWVVKGAETNRLEYFTDSPDRR